MESAGPGALRATGQRPAGRSVCGCVPMGMSGGTGQTDRPNRWRSAQYRGCSALTPNVDAQRSRPGCCRCAEDRGKCSSGVTPAAFRASTQSSRKLLRLSCPPCGPLNGHRMDGTESTRQSLLRQEFGAAHLIQGWRTPGINLDDPLQNLVHATRIN